jgi:small-conductance mechanosensitive channel
MLDTLRSDHRRIQKLAGELETQLVDAEQRHAVMICKLRWELLRELLQHAAAEQAFVDAELAADAGALDACRDFARSLREHVADWSLRSPAREWPAFRRSLRIFLRGIHAQIDLEEASIFASVASERSRSVEPPRGTAPASGIVAKVRF